MAFWKPGTVAPGSDVPVPTKSSAIDREVEKDPTFAVFNPLQNLSLQQQRLRLPIFQNSTCIFTPFHF